MKQLESDYASRFSGIGRLYGHAGLEKIKQAKILIIGIGGVGSWVAEALARTGVGAMTLVDLDDICVTNINRQVLAMSSTVGQFKVDAMKKRVIDIHPECVVETKQCFFNPKNLNNIFDRDYDFVVDACDDFTNKCYLIEYCRNENIPLVVMGGAGGKTDPLQIRVTDMSISQNDRLLARLRKKLRQEFKFPLENAGDFGVWAVWSHERAVYPTADGCLTHRPPGLAKNMDCEEGFGSASFVTGAFAFATTSIILKSLTKGLNNVINPS
jgi:tRNA A37 threonylcarbamoyladenosine dehydratase